MKNLIIFLLFSTAFICCQVFSGGNSQEENYLIKQFPDKNLTYIFISENECSSCAINTIKNYINQKRNDKFSGVYLYEPNTIPKGLEVLKSLPESKIKWNTTTDDKLLMYICKLTNTRGGVFSIFYGDSGNLIISKIS